MLSTAKYPASEIYRPNKATFSPEDEITFFRSDYEVKSKIVVPYKNLQVRVFFFKFEQLKINYLSRAGENAIFPR